MDDVDGISERLNERRKTVENILKKFLKDI
jgi:predicted transcriptional regulator